MVLHKAQGSSEGNFSKKTIAVPSDPVSTREDVESKLKIYGAIQAMRRGRLPDNKQLDDALVFVRDIIFKGAERAARPESNLVQGTAVSSTDLSDEGRDVVLDVRDILETSRQLLKQKNADEILQDFIHDMFSVKISSPHPGVELPLSMNDARKDGETAVHHLRTIFRLILTNREARKLMRDSKLILRDLFARTAVAAAERARPSAQELQSLDDAAPAQDWAGSMDDMEEIFMDATDEFRGETEQKTESGREGPWVENNLDKEKNEMETAQKNIQSKEKVTNGGAPEVKYSQNPFNFHLKDRLRSLIGRVPEKHRAQVQQEYNGAKAYLQDEFPPDRQDQFIWRLKKVVHESQATDSYQSSISWLLAVIRRYFANTRAVATSHASQTNELFAGDPLLARTVHELRMIAERGAGGHSLDGVLDAVDVLWKDAREDAEMRKWWEVFEIFLRKTLLKPGYITSPEFTSQARKLRASGRLFFSQKHKSHTDSLVHAAQTWSRAWLEDPLHVRLYNDWEKLIRDLMFDEKGELVFKSDLWKDMRTVILPGLVRKIAVIPIPRIEYVDEDLELVIENLTLQGPNLFPKTIEVNAQHYSKLQSFSSVEDEHRSSLTLTFSGIQTDMREVAFQYHKKLQLGSVKDEGLADVFIGGHGITIKVKVGTVSGRGHSSLPKSPFIVQDVSVKVEQLKFSIKESKHDILYQTLRPVATRLIRKHISKALSNGIRAALEYVAGQLAAARQGMADAKADDGSRREALKELLFKQPSQMSSIKSKRNSTLRVVPTSESILFSEISHKKSWIRRQAEKNDQATEGEGWRSKAFDI